LSGEARSRNTSELEAGGQAAGRSPPTDLRLLPPRPGPRRRRIAESAVRDCSPTSGSSSPYDLLPGYTMSIQPNDGDGRSMQLVSDVSLTPLLPARLPSGPCP